MKKATIVIHLKNGTRHLLEVRGFNVPEAGRFPGLSMSSRDKAIYWMEEFGRNHGATVDGVFYPLHQIKKMEVKGG